MATGTGKIRTAAVFVRRLFEAGIVTCVLRHFDGIRLGLTATPCVAEADALPEEGLFMRDALRFLELAEPT